MTPESAKTEMLRANGVDSLLKLLQQFLNSKKIYYYVLGALTLLTGEGEQLDLEVCEVVRRRLGLTLIVDSVESFQKDPFYCTQLLLFLQRCSDVSRLACHVASSVACHVADAVRSRTSLRR